MFDARLRAAYLPWVDRFGATLGRAGFRPLPVTILGWLIGVGACAAVALEHWTIGLVLWLTNRLLDGLDGAVARHTGASAAGGFADLLADFSIYAGFLVGVAIALPDARLVAVILLATYYLSGAALLTLAPLLAADRQAASGRTVVLAGGLAEGAETVAVYALVCLFPDAAPTILGVFAAAVLVTAGQRTVLGIRLLNDTSTTPTETPTAPKDQT